MTAGRQSRKARCSRSSRTNLLASLPVEPQFQMLFCARRSSGQDLPPQLHRPLGRFQLTKPLSYLTFDRSVQPRRSMVDFESRERLAWPQCDARQLNCRLGSISIEPETNSKKGDCGEPASIRAQSLRSLTIALVQHAASVLFCAG